MVSRLSVKKLSVLCTTLNGEICILMDFSQITIFPISSRRDWETIAAGINARKFSLILSEHKLKSVFHMLTYCCQCQVGFLEINMHTWELFPLCVIFGRMLIFSRKRLVLIPKDTYNQYQFQCGNYMHDSQSWLVLTWPKSAS